MISKQNQTTFDLTTQTNGDVRSVLEFCLENDLQIAENLIAGSEVSIPQSQYRDDDVLSFYRPREIELATGESRAPDAAFGIGVMIIQTDFDVT